MAIIVATNMVINMTPFSRLATAMGMGMDTTQAHRRMETKQSRRMARVMADIRITSAPERRQSRGLAPCRAAYDRACFRAPALNMARSLCYVHTGLIITGIVIHVGSPHKLERSEARDTRPSE